MTNDLTCGTLAGVPHSAATLPHRGDRKSDQTTNVEFDRGLTTQQAADMMNVGSTVYEAMRAKFMAKRKELYLEKHPETAKGKYDRTITEKSSDMPSFATDTSRKFNVTDRQIRQEVRRQSGGPWPHPTPRRGRVQSQKPTG